MTIPPSTNLRGRRVKLLINGDRTGWGSVEQDTGPFIKVRFGMVTGKWEAKAAVIDVEPPITLPTP